MFSVGPASGSRVAVAPLIHLLLAVAGLAGCHFVAYEDAPAPGGAWEPRDNALGAERSGALTPVDAGAMAVAAEQDAGSIPVPEPDGGDEPATAAPDGDATDVALVDGARQRVTDGGAGSDAAMAQTAADAGVDASPPGAAPPPDPAAEPAECIRGFRFCDGLDYVECRPNGRWSRTPCVAPSACFDPTCHPNDGCGRQRRAGAACDGASACDAGMCDMSSDAAMN